VSDHPHHAHFSALTRQADASCALTYKNMALNGTQMGIWFGEQTAGSTGLYTVAHYVEINGTLDVAALQAAIRQGLTEADTIHAQFSDADGQVNQSWVWPVQNEVLDVPIHDLMEHRDPVRVAHLMMEDDLAHAPLADQGAALFSHQLFQTSHTQWLWYQRFHHLCVDGYSFMAITRRVLDIYNALISKQVIPVTPFEPFDETITEYQHYLNSDACQKDKAFWQHYIADFDRAPTLAVADIKTSGMANTQVRKQSFSVSLHDLQASLKQQASRIAATDLLVAGVYAYLQRITQKTRIVCGMPFMRRMGSAALCAIGPTVNVLPVQLHLDGDLSLLTIAERMTLELRRVRKHQRYDAEQLQRDCGLAATGQALYNISINLKLFEHHLPIVDAEVINHVLAAGPVDDLEFSIIPAGDTVLIELLAHPERYSEMELNQHTTRIQAFLVQALAAFSQPIGTLPLLTHEEILVIESWSTGAAVKPSADIHFITDLLLTHAADQAEYPVLHVGNESLSNLELLKRINQLSHLLCANGIGQGDIVALALPRSVDAVVALLAVLNSGAAYLPLDLAYPAERIQLMCDDAKPVLILTHTAQHAVLPAEYITWCLDEPEWQAILAQQSGTPLANVERKAPANRHDLAGLIYTSGSTGKPKGVMVTHAGLINLVTSHQASLYEKTAQQVARIQQRRVRALHSASFSFDASWEQLFWLLLGHELWLSNEDERRDAQMLTELVHAHQIDTLDVPPSLLAQMLDCGLMENPSHQPCQILIGSEAAPPALWQQLQQYPALQVTNFYGPTEYTVDAVSASVPDSVLPVIGRPIANTEVYVLDPLLNPVPVGVAGELYLSGSSMTVGYWQQAAMTAVRFVANPFKTGERMYRTGDLVRWNETGHLVFIGRTDHQVKVRGFRIELGDVESALAALPGVASAVIVAEPFAGSHRLLGYCVLQQESSLTATLLQEQLAQQVPDYMVPTALRILDRWPMTVNGKIDKRALPPIEIAVRNSGRAARTPEEILVCQAIVKILNLPDVCADDDFFALGGDSISAMALGNALRRNGFLLRPKDIFSQRSAEQMALALQPLKPVATQQHDSAFTLPALPMTRWFSTHFSTEQHFAHAVIVNVPDSVSVMQLEIGLSALMRAHPVLRSVYENGVLKVPTMADITLHGIPANWISASEDDYDTSFQRAISRLNPAAGIMGQLVLCHQNSQQLSLMVVLHHLVVDGVSWRILLPELEFAVMSAVQGAASIIPPEEYALTDWAAALNAQVARRRETESAFWLQQLSEPLPPLGSRALTAGDTYANVTHQRLLVPSALSQSLLLSLPTAYRVNIEEILLTVVAKACANVFAMPTMRFMLESHGRHAENDLQDLNRTVGWLTNEYPVLLAFDTNTVDPSVDLSIDVKTVKQALRQTPDAGLGYSILRYLDDSAAEIRAAEIAHRPSVLFNYLGRFTQSTADWTPQAQQGRFADVFAVSVDGTAPVLYPLEVNIFVDESAGSPQLAIHWSSIDTIISSEVIAALHQQVLDAIEQFRVFAELSPVLAANTLVSSETIVSIEQQQTIHLTDAELKLLTQTYGVQEAVLPILPLQEGLLFHAQLGDAASQYNSITRLDLNGEIDVPRLRNALDAVLARHPQLAARFDLDVIGQPLQLIPLTAKSERWRWPWQFLSLAGLADDEQELALAEIQKTELYRPFAIATADAGALIHAVLIERADARFTLFLTAHHLVVDGWSTPILIQDLLTAYSAGAEQLPATRVSFPQIMRELAGRDREQCRQVWGEALHGAKPTCLFADGLADAQSNTPVKEAAITLSSELAKKLTATAQKQGLTLNTLMQGAWAAQLSIMSGRDDVIFGTPVSGRFSPIDGIEEHIGLFSNTIPVRMKLDPQQPLIMQLAALQAQQIHLMEYDAIGLGDIQRLAGGETLFDTLLVVENYPDQTALFSQTFYNMQVTGLHNRGYTHYPITALVLPGDEIHVLFEYREQVGDIQLWIERFQLLLAHLAEDSRAPWSSVAVLTESEQRLLTHVNNTAMPLPAQTLNDVLQAQVQKTPQVPALADISVQLSYQAVNERVSALASHLIEAGVQPGDVVAVALPRSVELTLALLAILRAGAAYLPLDVSYPDDRLAYMVHDAKPPLIITESALQERVSHWGAVLLLDQLDGQEVDHQPMPSVTPEMGAYLLYTSGSTGKPKGVLVSHAAIVNRILWMQHEYQLTPDDVVLQKTPCSFDVSVWEFFWSMMVGAQLMMAPPESHRDPEALTHLISEYQITTLHFVPSMLAAFVSHLEQANATDICRSLRRVFCSGEALSRELAEHYASLVNAPLHNLYGPTEAAVDVTYKPAAAVDAGTELASSVPIGIPVWNTQLRVLDAALRAVPVGVAGELYLCGVQLADGYLGKPAMTATRFVADPYADGQRMYRTGDVVRWLPTGDVEYLGRSDDQLKIRGQRIELGEIEAAMLALPGVVQAAVHARVLGGVATQAGMDSRQLVGYVVAANVAQSEALDPAQLRQLLSDKLPVHMVPVAIVAVPSFPLSANGKLDRKALPDPGSVALNQGRLPAPGLESEIAALFMRLLNVSSLSADDDFFALGGHSLLAMRLAAELRKQYNKAIAVSQIMVAPSVAKLAALLRDDASLAAAKKASFSLILRLREGQGTPLICIHPASGFAWQYSALLRYLPVDRPVIGLQSPRPDGVIGTCADLDQVCKQHLRALRSVQPVGPYALLGYSLGGTIAQGMAARLQQAGETVSFLGLLDTYPPEGQDWSGPTDDEAQEEVRREQAQFMMVAEESADDYAEQEKHEMFGHIVANYQDAVRLLSQGKTPVFDGKAELFVATRTLPAGMDIQQTWAPYIHELQEHHFDCSHEDILSPESLETLGPILANYL
jgi:amino acid adenylation domain-containing protein/non-ribosomal peptide synthase protein (TIGR01720 family)